MIKGKIEKLISNYKKITTEFLDQIARWEADQLYSSDHRTQKIREVKSEMQANDAEFNDQLQVILTEEQTAITKRSINKPADYQEQINAAIGFIGLLGDKISDEKAFELVKPFFGDYVVMKNFYSVLITRWGKDGLPITLSSLGRLDQAINSLDNLKIAHKSIFDNGTNAQNSLSYAILSKMLLDEAESVDNILRKADELSSASFEDIQMELHKELMGMI